MTSTNYEAVTQQYIERHADLIKSKRTWQMAFGGMLIINAFLGWGHMVKDDTPDAIPYIVEVDSLGKALAMQEAVPTTLEDIKITKAHIFNFIEKARTVVADTYTLRKNMEFVDKTATPTLMTNFFRPYFESNNPFLQAADISRTVEPVSFLKQGEDSYIIEWDEETRNAQTKALEEKQRWKAVVTIYQETDRTVDDLKQDILNPFGLYVTDISWSRTSSL